VASLTLVEGPSFCISSRTGDLVPGGAHGLFFLDTRFVSQLELFVNGVRPEPLAVLEHDPFGATFVGRGSPSTGQRDSTLLIERHRWIGRGLREDVVVRNLADEATYLQVEVALEADFADVADVRAGIPTPEAGGNTEVVPHGLSVTRRRGGPARGVRLQFSGEPVITPAKVRYEAIVAARGDWRCCIEVVPVVDGDEIEPRYRCGEPVELSTPAERLERWRQGMPEVETDHPGLARVVERSAEDLGSLRLFDPELPERTVVAAGAPWAMSLFGRDSLITAWMALLIDPDIALGVLETLARFQGREVDPRTEEQPGRILHEMGFGGRVGRSLGGGNVYYGSVDATPLFVMLLGELRRWGLANELVERLLPHADRALAWIEEFGDLDGDGYVEYQRANDRGLLHQGWKDSPDAVRFADGRVARPPIALAEVQGYVYSAYLARAHFAREADDETTFQRYRARATELRTAFNRDFWLADRGCVAMGLDRNKEPIDAVASNMGHCLWTGILDADKAAVVAERLLSPDMFSGWGIRTLARSMTGYNPISYQTGSVWPHDNALAAAGLMRYGFVEQAQRVIMAQLDAALALDARLPELFSGLDRGDLAAPIVYPSSCSPQAWAAAAPLLSLRTLLRFDPWIPAGKLWLSPVLPDPITLLHLERVPLLGGRISVLVDGGVVKVEGLPPEVEVISEGRDPITSFE
jgi:glycogen debranching enzyme